MNLPQEIQCVFTDNSYTGSIYISNLSAAMNLDTLKSNKIKAVITVARGAFLPHNQIELPNYLYLPADDHKQFDISQFFEKTNHFIEKNRKKANILIHCIYGISRSATIIVAYLMKRYKLSYITAYQIIKQKRPKIKPNTGFINILKKYAENIDNNTSKKQQRQKIQQCKTQVVINNQYKQQPKQLQKIIKNLRKDNQQILIKIKKLKIIYQNQNRLKSKTIYVK